MAGEILTMKFPSERSYLTALPFSSGKSCIVGRHVLVLEFQAIDPAFCA